MRSTERHSASRLLRDDADLERLRALLARLGQRASVVDFEEQLLQPTLRERVRLWLSGDTCAVFAWVDDYDNLWFELDPALADDELEQEVVAWGLASRRGQAEGPGPRNLDASCDARNRERSALLERHGFQPVSTRSLRYARALSAPLPDAPLPEGLTLRPVRGEGEVDALVALHRACFGTEHMTAEARLAIMRAPGYEPELDMVAVAPGGELAGFCVGGFADQARRVGYTDPIGVHPAYRRRGLTRAMMVALLGELRRRGAETAEIGTSNENAALCCLAESLGYTLAAERVWFTRVVD